MTPLILRPPQIPMDAWVREHKRCSLWAGMGIGKSSSALFSLEVLRILGDITDYPVLVVGPMRVARDTWPDEAQKWSQFEHLVIVPLTGTPEERIAKLKRKAHIFTVSYELLPWLVEHFLAKWPFRYVVADESDRLKGFREKPQGTDLRKKKAGSSGKRAFQIGRVAHTLVERWINLTGTPSPNGLKDLWGQMWFVDRGERLGRTSSAFKDRWFRLAWSGHGIEPMPHAEKEIHALLHDVCLYIDPKDYFDLAEPIPNIIKVKLPPAVRKLYKQLEREMFVKLASEEEVEVFNAAALSNKCLQFANGAVYTTYPEWAPVHNAKLEALESVQAESGGMPLLVAYSFKSDVERIKKAFPKAVELRTEAGMAAFKAGDSPMGLAHPKSMGHGIDGLQYVTNHLVRYGHGWDLGERMQMLERIGPMRQMQAGLDRAMFVTDIVAEGTVDEDVIEAHVEKRGVQDALLLAMKRRPT